MQLNKGTCYKNHVPGNLPKNSMRSTATSTETYTMMCLSMSPTQLCYHKLTNRNSQSALQRDRIMLIFGSGIQSCSTHMAGKQESQLQSRFFKI
eukprot:12563148-Ditylum_brightwellii.AAC.1